MVDARATHTAPKHIKQACTFTGWKRSSSVLSETRTRIVLDTDPKAEYVIVSAHFVPGVHKFTQAPGPIEVPAAFARFAMSMAKHPVLRFSAWNGHL